jgi:hypothetical protein
VRVAEARKVGGMRPYFARMMIKEGRSGGLDWDAEEVDQYRLL